MPAWLRQLLEADGRFQTSKEPSLLGKSPKIRIIENQVSGVVSVVERLLQQDHTTEYAYTCHPCVQHVSKLQKEGKVIHSEWLWHVLTSTFSPLGGFCGYRNIQMMVSYINGAKSQGFYHFDGKLPTIFQIQEFIEHAWDLEINAHGRLETGGIRGTRKYIGTSEVSPNWQA
jgi:zinc finger-containing ubiquitin peptidase 1